MAKFKKGDRVRKVKKSRIAKLGATGTVMEDNSDIPFVKWDSTDMVEEEFCSCDEVAECEEDMELIDSITDPTVDKVIAELKQRSEKGISKYGTTLSDNPLSLVEWLQHAKEEAMDDVLYLERAIDEIKSKL